MKQVMMGHGGDVRCFQENNLRVFECFIPSALERPPPTPAILDRVEPKNNEPPRRNVGIAVRQPSLSYEIMERMARAKAENVLWHLEFDQGYDFIITDDPSIVDQCIDEGISVAEFKPDTPTSEIVRKTLIRLRIRERERTKDA